MEPRSDNIDARLAALVAVGERQAESFERLARMTADNARAAREAANAARAAADSAREANRAALEGMVWSRSANDNVRTLTERIDELIKYLRGRDA